MPLYTFQCPCCGKFESVFRKIEDRFDRPNCPKGCMVIGDNPHPVEMRRCIEAPAVQADIGGYQSPIDGRWIEGRVARNEDLRRNNCRPWEGMESEKKAAMERAKEADKVYEKGVEAAVYNTFNNMSAEKQRALSQGV